MRHVSLMHTPSYNKVSLYIRSAAALWSRNNMVILCIFTSCRLGWLLLLLLSWPGSSGPSYFVTILTFQLPSLALFEWQFKGFQGTLQLIVDSGLTYHLLLIVCTSGDTSPPPNAHISSEISWTWHLFQTTFIHCCILKLQSLMYFITWLHLDPVYVTRLWLCGTGNRSN